MWMKFLACFSSKLDYEMFLLPLDFGQSNKTFYGIYLHFLNITFAKLPSGESIYPGEFSFFYISPLKSLNLVLIPGAKLDGQRGTWAGSLYE